jgi:phage major head subunit gpT-like protein
MFTEASVAGSLSQTELDEIFRQNLELMDPPGWASAYSPEIFKVTNTTHSAYFGKVHRGPGFFQQIGEVQTVPTYLGTVANKYTVIISPFAESIDISKDLVDDDLHSEWQSQVAEFALAARESQSYNAFGLFRNAFTTTLTPDGAALCDTHTLIGGGTQINEIVTADISGATSSALTTAAVEVGQKFLAQMKAQSGISARCVGDILLVPPALFFKANQIAHSALVAENGNNGISTLSLVYALKPMQSVYLSAAFGGSDTAWFLLDSRKHAVRRFLRQGLQTFLRPWGMSNNRTYNYQANYREAYAATDYIGVVGALGTTA